MMKNLLLAGAAAVAVAASAGAASAQSKFEVRLGGDAMFMAGFTDQKLDTGLRSSEFYDRFRLNIVATAKADNGLEYGGRIRLRSTGGRGNNNTDTDRAYIFIGGGFGQVTLGTHAGVSDEYGVIGPVVDFGGGILGGYDGFWSTFLAGSSTGDNELPVALGYLRTAGSSDASSRITYVSPEFAGLKLAASYATKLESSGTNVNRRKNDDTVQDLYEVGLLYSREFSGVSVAGSVFYSGGDISASVGGVEDVSSWAAGLQFGYAGFKFGGFYANHGDTGYMSADRYKEDQVAWGLSGSYETGPVTLGLAYSNYQDAGDTTTPADRQLDLFQVTVNYVVAPGLTVGAEWSHFDLDTEAAATDDRGNVFILQSVLVF